MSESEIHRRDYVSGQNSGTGDGRAVINKTSGPRITQVETSGQHLVRQLSTYEAREQKNPMKTHFYVSMGTFAIGVITALGGYGLDEATGNSNYTLRTLGALGGIFAVMNTPSALFATMELISPCIPRKPQHPSQNKITPST